VVIDSLGQRHVSSMIWETDSLLAAYLRPSQWHQPELSGPGCRAGELENASLTITWSLGKLR
jgi:hypothetical protein